MLAGISSETEIDTYTYRLKQDAKPITVKFDVSIMIRERVEFWSEVRMNPVFTVFCRKP